MASFTLSRRLPSLGRTTITKPILTTSRSNSSFSNLIADLTARRAPLIYDSLTPDNSHKLQISLSSSLPPSWTNTTAFPPSSSAEPAPLPPSHHLVYFNPAIAADQLLPDGTDPLQSPGEPFVRRMWAGGYLNFGSGGTKLFFSKAGKVGVCMERIRDVQIKGKEGDEKVFVGIERRFGKQEGGESENSVRERLWAEKEEDLAGAEFVERRNIVFLRERSKEQAKAAAGTKATKVLKAQHTPDFSYKFTPSASLLFRYSALTFNAHRIHLDPQYCREIEGHRDLLFHGPLSLTMLLTQLEAELQGTGQVMEFFEYRNLAPLYCNEELKLCGKKLDNGKFEMWAENAHGALAVKGTARVGKSR